MVLFSLLFHLLRPQELQSQVVYQCLYGVVVLRGKEAGVKEEGAEMGCPVGAGHDVVTTDEPVSNVDVSGHIFHRGLLLQKRRNCDIEV